MYTTESTPSPSLAKMLGSSKLTLFLSLIKNCCEKLGEPANDRIASGSDFEEVAILEALKAMLNIRHDVVVVLESTTKEKILGFEDEEGELREDREGIWLYMFHSSWISTEDLKTTALRQGHWRWSG